ncbi:hypothetical protein F443_03381, partial [Phytophthora nicotianae P1569]
DLVMAFGPGISGYQQLGHYFLKDQDVVWTTMPAVQAKIVCTSGTCSVRRPRARNRTIWACMRRLAVLAKVKSKNVVVKRSACGLRIPMNPARCLCCMEPLQKWHKSNICRRHNNLRSRKSECLWSIFMVSSPTKTPQCPIVSCTLMSKQSAGRSKGFTASV